MNIAIFGSAFNPPTLGHADVIQQLLDSVAVFDTVLLVPSFKHAFDKRMMDYKARIAMLNIFARDLNKDKVEVLAIEHEICQNDTPVYTYDLLTHIEDALFPDANLSFVIGPDNQQNWHKFYKAKEITERWNIVHANERINVRSTQVRQHLVDNNRFDNLVTAGVHEYLKRHRKNLINTN